MSIASRSDLDALGAQLGHDGLDALLVDRAHAVARDTQGHPALLRLEPEALRVQVGQETPAPPIVGVRDGVTGHRLLAGDLTDSGHGWILKAGAAPMAPAPA